MKSKNEMDILLDWLSANREEAERLYLELRKRLVFTFRSCHDPEDLVSEAIMRTLNNIKEGKVTDFSGNPLHYISRIASHVKSEGLRALQRETPYTDIKEPTAEATQDNQDNDVEELSQILDECLKIFPEQDKNLLLEYLSRSEGLSIKEHRKRIAEKWNITVGHLRVKIHRMKEKLHGCVNEGLKRRQG